MTRRQRSLLHFSTRLTVANTPLTNSTRVQNAPPYLPTAHFQNSAPPSLHPCPGVHTDCCATRSGIAFFHHDDLLCDGVRGEDASAISCAAAAGRLRLIAKTLRWLGLDDCGLQRPSSSLPRAPCPLFSCVCCRHLRVWVRHRAPGRLGAPGGTVKALSTQTGR